MVHCQIKINLKTSVLSVLGKGDVQVTSVEKRREDSLPVELI